jgi:hypothetical protein
MKNKSMPSKHGLMGESLSKACGQPLAPFLLPIQQGNPRERERERERWGGGDKAIFLRSLGSHPSREFLPKV